MNRLQAEFRRLYLSPTAPGTGPEADDAPPGLIDAHGQVRALVLELARPADWEPLGQVWRAVQTDLDLPAPAIAVSGTDGLQLWFSLRSPVGVDQAQAFLARLVARYLPDAAPQRLGLMPAPGPASSPGSATHARPVPALQPQTGHWSVFVAPDLAPVFADTPWLDSPPGDEGQARLLRDLQSIPPDAWAAALARLDPAAEPAPAPVATVPADAGPTGLADQPGQADPEAEAAGDARRFLQTVMNDAGAPLALRVEAAKALLPQADGPRAPRCR